MSVITTSQVKEAIEALAAMSAKASITPSVLAGVLEKLMNEEVTGDLISEGAVTSDKIADGGVTTAKVADGAINSSKIANGSINAYKMDSDSIQTSHIVDKAVTADKIANGSINAYKMDSNAIQTSHITDAAVTLPKVSSDVKGYIGNRISGNDATIFSSSDPLREIYFDNYEDLNSWLDSLGVTGYDASESKDGQGNAIPTFFVRVKYNGEDFLLLNFLRGVQQGEWVQYAIGASAFYTADDQNQYIIPQSDGKIYYRTSKNGTWSVWKSDTSDYDLTYYIANEDNEYVGVTLDDLMTHRVYVTDSVLGRLRCHYVGDGWFSYDKYTGGKMYRCMERFAKGVHGVYCIEHGADIVIG